MYRIVICGPVVSGKTALANTLLGNSMNTYYRITSELGVAHRMVYGTSQDFKIYPSKDAAAMVLEILRIDKHSQDTFYQKIYNGYRGYKLNDIAFIQTEHSSELLDAGVEITEMPSHINKQNRQFIYESIYDADLIICCINLDHFHPQDSEDFIREMLYQVRKSDSFTLFAVTHCYLDDRDVNVERWKEIRAQISSELHSLYSHFDDSQLFFVDLGLYSLRMGSPNALIINDNRILNLKVTIWRQIAKTYYRRNASY